MVKRPPNSQSTCSSEYELKPDIESDDNDDENETKAKISKAKSPKKARVQKSPLKPKKDSTPREAPRPWTLAEDLIFLEIMSKHLKAGMWEAVKQDGRLGYRGGPGISAHLTSVMNKVKKASGV